MPTEHPQAPCGHCDGPLGQDFDLPGRKRLTVKQHRAAAAQEEKSDVDDPGRKQHRKLEDSFAFRRQPRRGGRPRDQKIPLFLDGEQALTAAH